jgi:hypothetical protein
MLMIRTSAIMNIENPPSKKITDEQKKEEHLLVNEHELNSQFRIRLIAKWLNGRNCQILRDEGESTKTRVIEALHLTTLVKMSKRN